MSGAVAKGCAIPAQKVTLEGEMAVPEGAAGIVLFAHGSGSSRHSPRNNAVARALRAGGIGRFFSTCSPRMKTWSHAADGEGEDR